MDRNSWGQRQLVRADSVSRQQQPARQTLFEAMSSVASGRLGDLEVEALRVPREMQAQRRVLINGRSKLTR
jgi:hypothetical protein